MASTGRPRVTAVIAFQRHIGMTPHGNVGPVTWRKLLWHYDYPSFRTASVRLQRRQRQGELGDGRGDRPARGRGGGLPQDRARPGRRSATSAASTAGTSRGHADATRSGSTSTSDRSATTRTSARGARTGASRRTTGAPRGRSSRRSGPPRRATSSSSTSTTRSSSGRASRRWYTGHDDHLHVRYCEKSYPIAAYRC